MHPVASPPMIVGIDLGTSTSEIAVLSNGVPTLVREIAISQGPGLRLPLTGR